MAKTQTVKKVVARKMKISKEAAQQRIEDALALFIEVVQHALEASGQGELGDEIVMDGIETSNGRIAASMTLDVLVSEERRLEFGV